MSARLEYVSFDPVTASHLLQKRLASGSPEADERNFLPTGADIGTSIAKTISRSSARDVVAVANNFLPVPTFALVVVDEFVTVLVARRMKVGY